MPRVFSYLRLPISGDPDAYRAECQARVEAYSGESIPGLPLAGVFVEESAMRRRAFARRPAAGRLRHEVEPGDHVVIVDSALAFRCWADLFEAARAWQEKGVHVHLIDLGVDSTSE